MHFPSRAALCSLLLVSPIFASSSFRGVENFSKLNDRVYRGAQPSETGLNELAKIGIKTIIDLREADGRARAEAKAVEALGMKYINVPMTGLTPPTEAEITKILSILEDDSVGPVFVHCKRGADRTGAVMAAYRIQHDHWDNRRALKEAMDRGMSFFQFPRQNYVKNFQPRSVEAKSAVAPETRDAQPISAPALVPVTN